MLVVNWDCPPDKTVKPEAPCLSRCGTIKIPPALPSMAVGVEHRHLAAALHKQGKIFLSGPLYYRQTNNQQRELIILKLLNQ